MVYANAGSGRSWEQAGDEHVDDGLAGAGVIDVSGIEVRDPVACEPRLGLDDEARGRGDVGHCPRVPGRDAPD